ncbi:MAG: NAD-dependent epimerase/dehydratase family protein [Promethearchaeia archaeon]
MNKKYKKSVIITGAGGFLGKNIINEFLDRDFHIVALDINEEELQKIAAKDGGKIEIIKIDLLRDDLVPLFSRLVEDCEEAYMIHLAGLFKFSAPSKTLFQINVALTKNVLSAAAKVNHWNHIIHISTVSTYGTPCENRNSNPYSDLIPYKEHEPQNPNSAYGVTKLMGEKYAWKYYEKGLPITVFRPTLIYGPENQYGLAIFFQIASICRNLFSGFLKYLLLSLLAIPCKGGTYSHFVHVEDIARACTLILQKDESIGESYNIADQEPINSLDFFNLMMRCEKLSFNWTIIPLSKFLIQRFDKIFTKQISNLVGVILSFLFKLYGLCMGYNYEKIPVNLSREWFSYFQSNYIWDIQKLQNLGFEYKYPEFKKGVIKNVLWYKKHNWLP